MLGQNGASFVLDKRDSTILFAYSPTAMSGVVCLDTSTAQSTHYATMLEGVKVFIIYYYFSYFIFLFFMIFIYFIKFLYV